MANCRGPPASLVDTSNDEDDMPPPLKRIKKDSDHDKLEKQWAEEPNMIVYDSDDEIPPDTPKLCIIHIAELVQKMTKDYNDFAREEDRGRNYHRALLEHCKNGGIKNPDIRRIEQNYAEASLKRDRTKEYLERMNEKIYNIHRNHDEDLCTVCKYNGKATFTTG